MPPFLREALDPSVWPLFVLVSARLGGLMFVAPMWSMLTLPRAARAAITMVLALVLVPLAPHTRLPEHFMDWPLPLALEMMIGLAIGMTAAVFVQGVALAGEVISLQIGLNLGPFLAPTPDVQVSGVGQLQSVLAIFVYLSVGGHLMLLRGLADSLTLLPPGAAFDVSGGARAVALLVGGVFSTAIQAAGPVMVTMLLVNVALALLSRAVPSLNAMMVAFPITIGVGLLMLGASTPFLVTTLEGWMHGLPRDVDHVLHAFRVASGG